jgi:hypothetical protein
MNEILCRNARQLLVLLAGIAAAFPAAAAYDYASVDYPGATQETISESGDVAGNWFDPAGNNHGFIATPLPGTK